MRFLSLQSSLQSIRREHFQNEKNILWRLWIIRFFSGFGQNVLGITTKLESLHRGKNAPIQIPDESNIPWAPETFDSPICDSVPRNCNSRLTQNEPKTAFLKNFHLFYSASENAERKNWFTCNWRQFRRYNSNPIQSQRRWCSWNDLASWWSSCSR